MFTCFALLAVLQLGACSVQTPPLKQCPGQKSPVIKVQSVNIQNAELGKKAKVDTKVVIQGSVGNNPVLQIRYASANGGGLTCMPSILPCELKLCGGTSRLEKTLTREWNNQCPIPQGTYTAHISVRVPNTDAAKDYIGSGKLNVTLKIVDNGRIEDCVSFPVTIKTD